MIGDDATGVGTQMFEITEEANYLIEIKNACKFLIHHTLNSDNDPMPTNTVYTAMSNMNMDSPGAIYHGYQNHSGIGSFQSVYLPVGTYQITVWYMGDPNMGQTNDFCSVELYRNIITYPPNANDTQGFRIKSIKDFTSKFDESNPVLASQKIYKYVENLDSENSSGVQVADFPGPYNYQTFVIESPPFTLPDVKTCINIVRTSAGFDYNINVGYEKVFEIFEDSLENSNGYIEHKFRIGTKAGLVRSNGFTSYVRDYDFQGKEYETNIYDANDQIKSKEVNTYENKVTNEVFGPLKITGIGPVTQDLSSLDSSLH